MNNDLVVELLALAQPPPVHCPLALLLALFDLSQQPLSGLCCACGRVCRKIVVPFDHDWEGKIVSTKGDN